MNMLTIKAGPAALEQIRSGGLSQKDIRVIVGAAGGPKWLILDGIDRYLFGTFFKKRRDPLYFLGSSIGTWRFSAALQKDPVSAIERFEYAYIDHQLYEGKPSAAQVTAKSYDILDMIVGRNGIDEILSHPSFRLSCISARGRGLVGSENTLLLAAGLAGAVALNTLSRKLLSLSFERTLFSDTRDIPPFVDGSDFPTQHAALTRENYKKVIMASGSIPLVMSGVTGISGARPGRYRDGGMVDYHPDLRFVPDGKGLVLYPHFIDHIIPGWLDKSLRWRHSGSVNMDNVVLVSPSREFVATLPLGKIPDRNDFYTFLGKDSERIKGWKKVVKGSIRMGDALGELIESGNIVHAVRPF